MKKVLLLLFATLPAFGALVRIQDTVYSAAGNVVTCTIYATPTQSWETLAHRQIRPNTIVIPVFSGVLDTYLEDNVTGSPAGTAYAIRSNCGSTIDRTTWVIPATGPVNLATIETKVLVNTTAIVALSQLSSGAASLNDCLVFDGNKWVPGSSCGGGGGGGSVPTPTGPLQFLESNPDLTFAFRNPVEYLVSKFDFAAQTPGGVLTAGVPATVTLSPGPLGVAGTDASHYLRVSGGPGTAEPVLITGGSCTGAASGSCTVTFTPANNHSGAWTIASDSGGLREAVLYSGGNATIRLDANRTIQVSANPGVVIDKSNLTIVGSGLSSVVKSRDNAQSNQTITASACNSCTLFNFAIDGNRSNGGTNPTFGCGLQLGTSGVGGANHVMARRLWIYHSAGSGIVVADTNVDVEISSSYIYENGGVTNGAGNGVGIFVYRAGSNVQVNGIRITDNYIWDNHNTITNAGPSSCIAVQGANFNISRNYCLNNWQTGGGQIVLSHWETGPGLVSDNIITMVPTALVQATSGIESDAGGGVTISGNLIKGHLQGGGIALEGNAAGPGGIGASNTVVSANTILGSTGITLNNAGGITRGTAISGNRIASGVNPVLYVDTATLSTTFEGNNCSDTNVPQISDNSAAGVYFYGNFPLSCNSPYTGVASASAINVRCNQVIAVSGATTINTLVLPADTAGTNGPGCMVTLIPIIGSTWVTGLAGNIGKASASAPGVAVTFFQDDASTFWPSR